MGDIQDGTLAEPGPEGSPVALQSGNTDGGPTIGSWIPGNKCFVRKARGWTEQGVARAGPECNFSVAPIIPRMKAFQVSAVPPDAVHLP